jgi:hypothetical protein
LLPFFKGPAVTILAAAEVVRRTEKGWFLPADR